MCLNGVVAGQAETVFVLLCPIEGFVDLVHLLNVPFAQSVEQCDPALVSRLVDSVFCSASFRPSRYIAACAPLALDAYVTAQDAFPVLIGSMVLLPPPTELRF